MTDKIFWQKIAEKWSRNDDGIVVPDDKIEEFKKAQEIKEEDLVMFDDISNDEINEILADLGIDDI